MSRFSRLPRSRYLPLAHPVPAGSRPRRVAFAAGAVCAALTCGAVLQTHAAAGRGTHPPQGPQHPQVTAAGSGSAARTVFSRVPEAGRPQPGPGQNILLAGLDRRAGLSKQTKDRLHVNGKQCDCTDVMMLLHISDDLRRVSVVSIPRDSYVPFAAHRDKGKGVGKVKGRVSRHPGKINSAYAHGGPALTVRTVEQATGVRIDHYAETDFTGFEKTVDRLGGARVCTAKALHDGNSGLELPVGTHNLDGAGALRYARARHVEPPGDLGRVRRQQRMVEKMLTTLTGDGIAGNPQALMQAARALHASVRTDAGLTVSRLARIGRQLRGLRPEQTEFATVPISDFDYRDRTWGSSLVWDKPRARALFGDLRADRPLTKDPRTRPAPGLRPVALAPREVTVRVAGEGRAAARAARELRADGFHVLKEPKGPKQPQKGQKGQKGANGGKKKGSPAAAAPHGDRTRIVYDPFFTRQAAALAIAMPDARMRPAKAKGKHHSPVFTVHPGSSGTRVVKVVLDRSSVEGMPVTGDVLDCKGAVPLPKR